MYLKTILINSDDQGVQAAAKGILWKLENESIITNLSNEKYDIMISYSHSNKDLCHQVYQNLIQSKYRVWLDFENMYGSTLQSMAEAIESSDMILICMSNPYKQSAYCRSEAEYAYTRQRHIIPLIMEKKYRPDGWLGFICASKMYVDFTKSDFEQAFQKLIAQIQLYQRQIPSDSTSKNESLTHTDEIIQKTETLVRKTLSSQSDYRNILLI
jgi:male-specific lethal 1